MNILNEEQSPASNPLSRELHVSDHVRLYLQVHLGNAV